ncbi:MAG: PilZ domain-containing protein [Gammaproteobacteria bacterium]|nr:PilZ domain-containing protein [Gammaproteobacteria bacterium]
MRRYIRHPSDIPIYVCLEPTEVGKPQPLNNISEGGLSFSSEVRIARNTVIKLAIILTNPPFHIQGKVSWCRARGDHYDVGVEFADADDLFKARMVEQVCYIEHYKNEINDNGERVIDSEQAAAEWIAKYATKFPKL